MSFKITTISAYISEDEHGEEGVVASLYNGSWMPLIMADEKRFKALRPLAEQIAIAQKKKIKLVRFSVREDLGTL